MVKLPTQFFSATTPLWKLHIFPEIQSGFWICQIPIRQQYQRQLDNANFFVSSTFRISKMQIVTQKKTLRKETSQTTTKNLSNDKRLLRRKYPRDYPERVIAVVAGTLTCPIDVSLYWMRPCQNLPKMLSETILLIETMEISGNWDYCQILLRRCFLFVWIV